MDDSELFIKMCDCSEIQQGDMSNGDFFAIVGSEDAEYDGVHIYIQGGKCIRRAEEPYDLIDAFDESVAFGGKFIWLPRQDQLQEMVAHMTTWIDTRPVNVLCRFIEWFNSNALLSQTFLIDKNTTIEQLWLAFVMKEKHNKIWNGQEWVKE